MNPEERRESEEIAVPVTVLIMGSTVVLQNQIADAEAAAQAVMAEQAARAAQA